MSARRLQCHPLTESRWSDFERLFGKNGACGGCWCMLWRLPRQQFESQKGDRNRRAMRRLVASGEAPGLLGYLDGEPVGWCALAPREQYLGLARSRVLKPVDERACWSIACLFVHRAHRNEGLSARLLRAAVDHARARGARILEGYPIEPRSSEPLAPAFAWTGIASAFRAAGFAEVARRSATRPIMRREIRSGRRPP